MTEWYDTSICMSLTLLYKNHCYEHTSIYMYTHLHAFCLNVNKNAYSYKNLILEYT